MNLPKSECANIVFFALGYIFKGMHFGQFLDIVILNVLFSIIRNYCHSFFPIINYYVIKQ